ncbi:MAG: hypothetical protein HY298_17280 [Verrucomicrobia bacterium]|nr:hypothetical protein [Verrucomicrobiota bacterium]
MQSTPRAAILASLFCAFAGHVLSATITSQADGDTCRLVWQSDEHIEISFSRSRGLLFAPITVRVDDRSFSFDGFYVAFNGERDSYANNSVSVETGKDSFRVTHLLEHPRLPSPIRVAIHVSMAQGDKAVRFKIDTDNGERVHLDRLGIGNHHGARLSPTRMFVTKYFVFEPPIEPFKLKYNYNCLRYWCFTMQNGITEMVGSDSTPRGFDFDESTGAYDVHTYCDTNITYTFVFTGKGPQEAMAHYRSTIRLPAPPTLAQLPGRVTIMTGYPIRERYEDFLDELTGRGVRDFIWLAYAPWPGDRKLVEPFGALYSIYDMYTDLFPEGPRKAEGWTPEWVRYESPGVMKRGYWDSTRCLPNLYIPMANGLRRQGTLGRELANRNFLRTPITELYNLKIFKEKVKPTALYLDVHASLLPEHYYDFRGRHYPLSEHLRQEKLFFEWARKFLGNVPVFSEVDCEPFAGIMDAGIFSPWRTPETIGRIGIEPQTLKAARWEYYPFLDVIHRERLLNSGAGAPFALPDYNATNMGLAISFGRPQIISGYPGTSQANVGGRVQLYYLSSAFHRMLGLSRMDRVDFGSSPADDGDDIHRQIATYSNGARIWSNRGGVDWEVDGLTLPENGYLIVDTNNFRQYRARVQGQTVEVVRSRDYDYFFSDKLFDFGPVKTSGAIAVRSPAPGRVVIYEVVRGGGIEFRLGQLSGTATGQKLNKSWILLTSNRKVPLKFPDITQDADTIRFGPPEMAMTLGYEFEFR